MGHTELKTSQNDCVIRAGVLARLSCTLTACGTVHHSPQFTLAFRLDNTQDLVTTIKRATHKLIDN